MVHRGLKTGKHVPYTSMNFSIAVSVANVNEISLFELKSFCLFFAIYLYIYIPFSYCLIHLAQNDCVLTHFCLIIAFYLLDVRSQAIFQRTALHSLAPLFVTFSCYFLLLVYFHPLFFPG